MAIRKMIQDSDPEIRQISQEVKEIDDNIIQIIQDMKDTLHSTPGIGISAIQIGEAKRIIYIHYEEKQYVVINPVITQQVGKRTDMEGCLSVKRNGFFYVCGEVQRSFIIEIEGQNEQGEKIQIVADGILARAFQHEIDHLNGILYTDKMIGQLHTFTTEEEKQQWKEERKLKKRGKVLLGMSGGVDSSVAAILLQEAGYEVIGATMKLWEEENEEIESGCCSLSATNDAKRVCDKLEIPHYTLNCKADFKKYVIDDFVNCYQCAKTPNPCIECNQYLKFGIFYQKAVELGCDYIATGHYAKIEYDEQYKTYVMKKARAEAKDQTYFLYRMPREVLPKVLFPLEELTDKNLVRKIAQAHELLVAHKKDSQEVCFIPNDNYTKFLEKQNKIEGIKPGNIVLESGEVVGKHRGLLYYTIGQRKGLGISYQVPLYVLRLDATKNEVVVGEEKQLYQKTLYANQLNFLLEVDKNKQMEVTAKVRYRSKEAKATILWKDEQCVEVKFEEPQRAITPGQSVVFYLGDVVLGGGKIV